MDRSAPNDQIEKILQSQTLANKKQLRRLLEFLSKSFESQEKLTADDVIRELWPDEIRTKRSSDVATEMNRLRHALNAYYHGEGESDPLVVCLPNRSLTGDGTQEKSWIAVKVREEVTAESAAAQVKSRAKVIGVIAALGVLGIVAYVGIRTFTVPPRPQSGRLDGTLLRVMDAEGKELWSRNFPEGFGPDWYYDKVNGGPHIWFADLEGKGHTSVLFSYSPAAATLEPHSSILICYSDRGREKWRWTPGRDLAELNGSPPTYKTHSLAILKATEERPLRLVVASQHDPWWPTQIALLDAKGITISEYWHSGGITFLTLADLDGDGRQEIIASGVSEYDHQATLVVLDPDRVFGASKEERPGFQIHGMGMAQERLRLLFPRSDLNWALFQFNSATFPTFNHGVLRLTVLECITRPPSLGCPVWYEFDRHFHLIAAFAGGDDFRSEHNKFFQTGKNPHTLSAEEEAAFQKVKCLVGCNAEFVPVGKLVP